MVQEKINRGRHTNHLAGRHSSRTNQCPPPPSSHFLQAGCPSCHPTNSVKTLKAKIDHSHCLVIRNVPSVVGICLTNQTLTDDENRTLLYDMPPSLSTWPGTSHLAEELTVRAKDLILVPDNNNNVEYHALTYQVPSPSKANGHWQ